MAKTKIPSVFNDTFNEKSYERKIDDKIYVPADKEFVKTLYETSEDGVISLKKDLELSKQQEKRLKLISKQMKKQKGRIKFLPIILVFAFIFALISVVLAFKNPILKAVLIKAGETAAGAKCEIESVNLKLLDSKLTVQGIAVANKNQPMKNLAEVSNLVLDFDLVQLLKGRMVADELAVEGIQLGTDRETSGALPEKEKKKVEKETTPEDFAISIENLVKEQTGLSKEGITEVFAQFNPETVVQSVYNQMSSPEIIKNLEPQAKAIVTGWQSESETLNKNVTEFTASAQELVATDISKISDPVQLKKLLDNLKTVNDNAQTIKSQVENAGQKLKTDVDTVQNISLSLKNAVDSDMKLLNDQLNTLSNLNLKDMTNLFSGELNGPAIQLLKKYAPIAETALAKVQEFQTSGSKKAEKKPKKKEAWRASGRTVEYRKDNVPDFLIRKTVLSGLDAKTGFALSGTITNISNDCDKLDEPVGLNVKLNRSAKTTEMLDAIIDMRKNRTAKALTANLSGTGYNFSKLTIPNVNMNGLPYLSGAASFNAGLAFDTDMSFDLDGALSVMDALIEVKPFEPAFAYSMYTRAIENINKLNLSTLAKYTPQTLLDLDIKTDLDKILSENLSKIFKSEIAAVRAELESKVSAEIEKLIAPIDSELHIFDDLKALVSGDTSAYASMEKKVNAKMAEVENKLKEKANAATDNAVKQATDQLPDELKNNDAVNDTINNTLDKFKKLF
ncbi:MAG: TIGR03545 family protein [Spirochaetaceae bacterium]|nr:TIGR03545 family protein [Spirochaetaceae bacterium]